jgi:hypothetical protein
MRRGVFGIVVAVSLIGVVALAGCAGSGGAGVEPASPSVRAQETLVLLDGRGTQGWEHVGPGRFVPQPDGSIRSEGGMGLFFYGARPFRDFVMELDFLAESRDANSGVYVRFPNRPADPWVAVREGYEIQIDDSQRDAISATGSVYTFSAPFRVASRPTGEWNRMRIEVVGQRYQIHLNGEKVNDYFGSRGREGFIGLQNHDVAAPVRFRDVRVTPLEVEDPPMRIGDLFREAAPASRSAC